MPEVVNQYTHTFIGQAIGSTYQFYMPMIPKLRDSNYFEIQVCQVGMRRYGASAPHDIFFLVGDIQGTKSQIVTRAGQIDSRVNLGMIVNYDGATAPANLTSPTPVEFRLNTMQPSNPFTVTICRLGAQELANSTADSFTRYLTSTPLAPSTLVPVGTYVNAQFVGAMDNGAGGPGTVLTVASMISPSNTLAVGQTIRMDGVADVTITALGTGTGGVGTYTIAATRDSAGTQGAVSITYDTINNAQIIMTWIIKEMSPYDVRRNELISY